MSLFGDVSQADIIKLHKASGRRLSRWDHDFDGKPLPELRQRIKVNRGVVVVFDHSADGQLLYFKERFLSERSRPSGDGGVRECEIAEARIVGCSRAGTDKEGAAELREKAGLNENLNRRKAVIRPQLSGRRLSALMP